MADRIHTSTGDRLGYVPALDGLRAISIALVLVNHSAGPIAGAVGAKISGDAGVNIFFVLSGFLITSLLHEEKAGRGRISFLAFYGRRFLRIVPAYLVMLAAVRVIYGRSAYAGVLACATYTYNIGLALHWNLGNANVLGIAWSLCVEEHFYLVWPMVFVLSGRRALFVASALAGLAATERTVLALRHADPLVRLYMSSDTRSDSLMIGCALALLLSDRAWRSRIFAGLSGPSTAGIAALALFFCSNAMELTAGSAPPSWSAFLLCHSLLTALLVASLLANPGMGLEPLLKGRFLVHVGRLSYALYLWHMLVFRMVDRFLGTMNPTIRDMCGWLLAFGVANLSYVLVEKPALRLKKMFARVPANEPAAGP